MLGGTVDREDKSLEDAALRECEEEIGFPQKNIDVWTMLPPLPDKSGTISVYGVIGNLGKIDQKDLKPNHDEVSDVFTVPIHFLCDPSNIRYTKFRVSSTSPAKVDYTMPVFTSSPIVWGLTACCLDLALYCLFPHDYQIVSRTHRMKQILPPNT
ncbi:mitochondrial coenzyme A diphosphatase NUDT8-like isoform X2 [Clavelina lepadiformis]|uniref:mitochondrial coenzyme A diphosphatase NUDT8-like isoform X2 n=1 Tax=Clavelina lepadiformis TaxID=159417 RepID=UPI004040FDDF